MKNSENVNLPAIGFIMVAVGMIICQAGLPFVIAGTIYDNSNSLFWQIAALIVGSLFVLAVAISFLTSGFSFMVENAYPDKEYIRVYFALLTFLSVVVGFMCYYFTGWSNSSEQISIAVKIFWVTAVICYVFCLWYSNKKIKNRISGALEHEKNIDKYLGDIFNEIKDKKLTYGAAFLKIEKEVSDKHSRIKCTNKIIFVYRSLPLEEMEFDYKSFLNDKVTLSEFYPLNYHHKSGRKT